MAEFEFLGKGLKKIFGSKNDRDMKARYTPVVARVNELEPEFEKLSDAELRAKTAEFKQRLAKGETLDQLMPEAFAACREASKRTLGMRHFDVQIIGGAVLHNGRIAEMTTGEGKTLVSTLASYLNALTGRGVHLVTVNDYLARRDAKWMSPIFAALDMRIGVIQSQMPPRIRLPAYRADVTYGTNSEFGFDYLRDNMKLRLEDQAQQNSHFFAIIDEVDSILIDEARTPLIIAGAADQSAEEYYTADRVVKQLEHELHYEVNEKDHHVVLTEEGIDRAQELAAVGSFYEPQNVKWPHHIDQALKANYLYQRDKDYVVTDGDDGPEIVIVDEFTGRQMPGRRWSDGLHQAVEAKEGLEIREENQTLATITYQNFFRQYDKLGGMTGTAMTEAAEFHKIYQLDVTTVPTNRRLRRDAAQDLIYRTESEKYNAVADEIEHVHSEGRPTLVGTTSVEKSERLAAILQERGIPHELLNAKNHEREAHIVANAGEPGAVTIATNMAGRGTDIVLGAGVKENRGLHVVGTERHEARRIDNQLRGRAGRQGDPGSSQFFLSLEDDLMRIFAKDWVGGMLQKLGMEEGQEIQSPMVTRMIERVQKKMEAHNFDIRKNLLEYDAVNNEQRKLVYEWRQSILAGQDQVDRVAWVLEGVCLRYAEAYLETEDDDEDPDVEPLRARFEQVVGGEAPPVAELVGKTPHEVATKLVERAAELYRARFEQVGPERMRELQQFIILQTIDDKWKDHLHALDYLRTGVGMRGYGQEDPKVVYRREAAHYFQQMIAAVQDQIVDLIFRVEAGGDRDLDDHSRAHAPQPGGAPLPAPNAFDEDEWGEYEDDIDWDAVSSAMQAPQPQDQPGAEQPEAQQPVTAGVGASVSAGSPPVALRSGEAGGGAQPRPGYRAKQQRARQVRESQARQAADPLFDRKEAAPNQPCPCGSGRKYKKCHGG